MNKENLTMDKIVGLCKNRGYVYPGSEIYGGLANTWDYGPKEIYSRKQTQCRTRCSNTYEPRNMGCIRPCWWIF